MTNSRNFIANFLNYVREIIESAETPFVLFAIILLPVLAPAVPATVTGIRLTTELDFHWALSATTSVVLELLGYVAAVSFIKAISKRWRKEGSTLSVILNGLAYGFYVVAMYLINVELGKVAGDSEVVNRVFAILSFITVPTGLLAAEHINDRSEVEEKEKRRQEERSDKMERYRIKMESSKNVPKPVESSVESSNGKGNLVESSKKVPDWRKVRPGLSKEQLESLANLSPDQMRQYAQETGYGYKTISNWRMRARQELELD